MLTGKDIHAAFLQFDPEYPCKWELLMPKGRDAYNAVAEQLNKTHIAPLQGLVRSLVALLDDDELMIEDSRDGWWTEKEKAFADARLLLGEDIP